MYVLERRRDADGRSVWERYALCGKRAPLEQVRQGQVDRKTWRVVRRPGTVAHTLKSRSVPGPWIFMKPWMENAFSRASSRN